MDYEFSAQLWQYAGEAAWVFVTLPVDIAAQIKMLSSGARPGFGSVRVSVAINGTSCKTSVFPDKKSHSYVLPIKKDVRTKAMLSVGDTCRIAIRIEDADKY